ncbi:hypothetical protein TVAG_147730 [Trichomonas vaginalis G3]|uniref:Uncharacterized protein n=1 Tax=Trichomonas vaginalis (strain ATCC PRA-98 / G3) TaxID=412133 RepID=A2GX69_TRIV3|nr:hypothetical protein TVAGG3_0857590 [Trichomonas vaginalis G3]XP_051103126.1 hypothetical protein TVAGG3_0420000 [Trichomonas vaginalis G3]XP_051109241.1 hypothetical protein TVAGG3_0140990 [Trichomonas vaginalis G3]EAX65417.1 hypothetical protein TVAG_548310 [Trichomonas vaginalis G3]EAX68612.1 hypothetical protein TVAG_516140 [Trichomonas vaginalis G3]EAX70776.1 hypothetical protein TVAG_093000 [Trichomonas vaginalis G3]EAX75662.1 hypothetical protein TVAG_349730 [Trichomonas vaginalis G|eukprot:XP_001278347.1 hypothetical protein [Trichomonas vaginalis G3]
MTQTSPTDKTQGVIDVEALKKEIREQILSELKEQKPEQKPERPKRKLSEKQLAALAAGRQKNPRLLAKKAREEAKAKEEQKAKEAEAKKE